MWSSELGLANRGARRNGPRRRPSGQGPNRRAQERERAAAKAAAEAKRAEAERKTDALKILGAVVVKRAFALALSPKRSGLCEAGIGPLRIFKNRVEARLLAARQAAGCEGLFCCAAFGLVTIFLCVDEALG